MSDHTLALRDYMKDVENAYKNGNATEHTYRSYLKQLLETIAPGATATNEPKHIKNCGAPDFIVTSKQVPLGYIETKDISVSLDAVEHTDQMRRYLSGLANLILTDYVEFRWYVTTQQRGTARLAKVVKKGKWLLDAEGMEQVSTLLQGFITTQAPTVSNPKELATRMASIAQLIRNAISLSFKSEMGAGSLHGQLDGFKQVLLPDLEPEHFADMYAQTICYGLFAARVNTPSNKRFTRESAAYDIPKTNPFLRKMFGHIAGPDLDERIVWAVDDLAEVLNHTDMEAILHDFGKRTRQEDPVVHFYETFLAEYDPKMRESRGVYYTPEPVVSYIVRSVDYLLKKDFGLADGLADATTIKQISKDGNSSVDIHKVQILDPATGTGTFLHSIIDSIHETFKGNKGMWSAYVSQHLLPRLFGFELLMAPYAVAHMKLGLQLKETGYDFRGKERLGVYLTNTLEEGFEGSKLPFVEWIIEEATAAGNIKHEAPVMVVIGNPPYSGHSANKGQWIINLLHSKDNSYFELDGQPLGERNPKWLNDDYVKFLRFAQWRIQSTGYGILAFITNHGYLDNPTFRGMRQSLLHSFDEIYVLDLHGNSKKKERSPDGSKDENVFDIQQGVAIGIFVKHQKKTIVSDKAVIHHAHLWGVREVYEKLGQEQQLVGGKYHWLIEYSMATTEWTSLIPESPYYLFTPQDINLREEYERYCKLTDMLLINTVGIVTGHDAEVIAPTLLEAEKLAVLHGLPNNVVKSVLYRPFDTRFIVYSKQVITRPRMDVMHHMTKGENIGIITTRQTRDKWDILAANHLVGHKSLAAFDINTFFPLYLYPSSKKDTLFDTNEPSTAPGGRRPNLSPAFIADISAKLCMQFITDGKGDLQQNFGPEDIFSYMYAVFHAPTYRTRYAEFLKIDFPRLPLTSDVALFRRLCMLGEQLVGLHLMEQYGEMLPPYQVVGDNLVEKVEYLVSQEQPEQGRVFINKTQCFEDVPTDVWNFHVGGYQVCHKWLKDRKGRVLSFDDIRHYQRIVAALAETIILMEQVDEAIEEHGGWPLK